MEVLDLRSFLGVGLMIRRIMSASHMAQTAAELFWFVSRWDSNTIRA
jgi:hypothetical protein